MGLNWAIQGLMGPAGAEQGQTRLKRLKWGLKVVNRGKLA